jgi:hypothetical protein
MVPAIIIYIYIPAFNSSKARPDQRGVKKKV